MLGVGGYIALQQADSLILLAQQRADKCLHRHQIVFWIELWRATRALDDVMRAVGQPRTGNGGRYQHLLPQVEDGSARRRNQGIDARQEAPGAWDIRLLQPGHHVELAFQEAGIPREAPLALQTPMLRLSLLVEIV